MFVNAFKKAARTDDDYDQYWANISTEKLDKDGEGTGEYYSASITVRMSKAAAEKFDEIAEKTSKKSITWANIELTDFWLKAASGGRNSKYDVLVLFINEFKEKDEKPASKKGRKA